MSTDLKEMFHMGGGEKTPKNKHTRNMHPQKQ